MAAQNIGIDLGLGFVKASDGKTDYIFPSVVGAGQDLTYQSELTIYTEPIDNMAITVDGKKYFVGEMAIRQSEILSRSLSDNHAQEKNTKVILLAALALYCEGRSGEFNVITGLPPGFYLANKDDLAALIQGTHRVIFNTEGEDQEKTITVSKIKIIPQPMGTLFHKLFDDRGVIKDKELVRSQVGIIDIGFRTTDFVMVDRLEYIDRLTATKTTAMSNVYSMMSDYLHREFHLFKEDFDMEEIVRKAEIKLDGELHSLTEVRKAACEELTFKILTELNSIWDKRTLDTILLSGGGGAALADYLLPELKTAVLVENSQTANVHGYLKLGHKIFGISEKSSYSPTNSHFNNTPDTSRTNEVKEATPVAPTKESSPSTYETSTARGDNNSLSAAGSPPRASSVTGSSTVNLNSGIQEKNAAWHNQERNQEPAGSRKYETNSNGGNNHDSGFFRRNSDKESLRSNLDKLYNAK